MARRSRGELKQFERRKQMIASGSVRQLLDSDARGAGSARFMNARGRRILKLVVSELQLSEGVHVGGLELEGELKHLDGFGGLVAGEEELPDGHAGLLALADVERREASLSIVLALQP